MPSLMLPRGSQENYYPHCFVKKSSDSPVIYRADVMQISIVQ